LPIFRDKNNTFFGFLLIKKSEKGERLGNSLAEKPGISRIRAFLFGKIAFYSVTPIFKTIEKIFQ
jgi:hypothetical protein